MLRNMDLPGLRGKHPPPPPDRPCRDPEAFEVVEQHIITANFILKNTTADSP
jgi:hypothetical protein